MVPMKKLPEVTCWKAFQVGIKASHDMSSAMRASFWIMLLVMRDSSVDLFGASRRLVKRKINVHASRRKRVTTIGTKGGKGLGYPKIYWGIVRAFT